MSVRSVLFTVLLAGTLSLACSSSGSAETDGTASDEFASATEEKIKVIRVRAHEALTDGNFTAACAMIGYEIVLYYQAGKTVDDYVTDTIKRSQEIEGKVYTREYLSNAMFDLCGADFGIGGVSE